MVDTPAVQTAFSWTRWEWHGSTLMGVAALIAGYAWIVGPWRRRLGTPPVGPARVSCFAGAMAVLVLALNGPLHQLSDQFLFSAHMVQHPLLLSFAMPILLLLGVPGWAVDRAAGAAPVAAAAGFLSRPLIAFAIANVTLILWHFAFAYDAAMADHRLHVVMHLTMMTTAVIGWWPVLSPSARFPALDYPGQMLYLFAMGLPMSAVGAMITLADAPLYSWYQQAPRISPLDPLDDQRLGGLLMWVPGMLVYWSAMTIVWFRWARRDAASDGDGEGAGAAG